MRRNAEATIELADACATGNAALVFFSTNEVFSGDRGDGRGYAEGDETAPAKRIRSQQAGRRAGNSRRVRRRHRQDSLDRPHLLAVRAAGQRFPCPDRGRRGQGWPTAGSTWSSTRWAVPRMPPISPPASLRSSARRLPAHITWPTKASPHASNGHGPFWAGAVRAWKSGQQTLLTTSASPPLPAGECSTQAGQRALGVKLRPWREALDAYLDDVCPEP